MSHENKIVVDGWEYPVPDDAFERSDATTEALNSGSQVRRMIDGGATPLRTIVAGSRSITNRYTVEDALMRTPSRWIQHSPSEIVVGGADGVDSVAEELARSNSLWNVITVANARWNKDEYGLASGPLRNKDMAEYADNLIAIWDGSSSGTRDMIEKALDNGLNVHVEQI